MATFKPVVFKSRNHIKSDGTTNIKIRVYHNREAQYIPTAYYIEPAFMGSDGEINAFHPESELYNYELNNLVQELRKASLKLGSARSQKMSCMDFKEFIQEAVNPDYDSIDFVAFCNEVINKATPYKTAEWYEQSLGAYIWFVGKDKIDPREITRHKITEWIAEMRKKGRSGRSLTNGAIASYVCGMRALFNLCKRKYNNHDLDIIRISNNPFDISIPKYKKRRKSVSLEVVKKIRDSKTDLKRAEMARDVFMMMFYLMGINIGDLYRLEPPVGGRLNYERSKMDRDDNPHALLLSIKIEPELKILLDKYSGRSFLSEIKNRYANPTNFMKAVNKGLACICDSLNMQRITSNFARHSWASIARNKAGVAKADVDFCLGHVSNDFKMADIYIEIDYSICDNANRKVMDLLK